MSEGKGGILANVGRLLEEFPVGDPEVVLKGLKESDKGKQGSEENGEAT